MVCAISNYRTKRKSLPGYCSMADVWVDLSLVFTCACIPLSLTTIVAGLRRRVTKVVVLTAGTGIPVLVYFQSKERGSPSIMCCWNCKTRCSSSVNRGMDILVDVVTAWVGVTSQPAACESRSSLTRQRYRTK